MLTAEMILTTVLVFGAVLFAATFSKTAAHDRGFARSGLLVFSVQAPESRVASTEATRSFFGALVDQVAELPDVTSAALTFRAPDRGHGLNLRMIAPEGFAASDDSRASVGIYGTISFSASSRTDEIAIRQALGADAGRMIRMFAGRGLGLALAGIAAGLAISVPLGRLVEGMLFGIEPVDPLVHAAVAVFLILVAGAASLLPARRAVAASPLAALRP